MIFSTSTCIIGKYSLQYKRYSTGFRKFFAQNANYYGTSLSNDFILLSFVRARKSAVMPSTSCWGILPVIPKCGSAKTLQEHVQANHLYLASFSILFSLGAICDSMCHFVTQPAQIAAFQWHIQLFGNLLQRWPRFQIKAPFFIGID